MSNKAIQFDGLGKKYLVSHKGDEIGRYVTLRETMSDFFRGFRKHVPVLSKSGSSSPQQEEFWALRDITFEVRQGERLAVIGRNGAGKSTLLKIASRITYPTTGRIEIKGRVASLLEVGTGFHPELTGRENIFLNGAILGMSRKEIRRKFDAIVEFSEIERFLDTPVKRYSSGMYVRLAFAVAAHLEPEILLVDEVLAVGDAAFQKKCLGKMSEVTAEGRTVLFVSHNMVAVQSLCQRAVWLDEGRVRSIGETGQVVSDYMKTVSATLSQQVWDDINSAPGNRQVRLRRTCIRPENGDPNEPITIRTPFRMEFDYWNLESDACLNLSLHVYNAQGVMVFNPTPVRDTRWYGKPFPKGLYRSVCHIPGDLMNDGIHRVELLVVKDACTIIYRHPDALVFDIQDDLEMRGLWHGKHPGAVRPDLQWETEILEHTAPDQCADSSIRENSSVPTAR